MSMTPRLQKLILLAHIIFSVGWFGAIIPYLALAIAGLTNHDEQNVRAACLSMELIGWYVIVPFSFAALLSGLLMSLAIQWGLFRHWWILAKFALTIFAIVILLQHMRDVSRVARMAMLSSADLRPELIHSAGGLLVLLAAMTLSAFKPWGMTPYGQRQASRTGLPSSPRVQEPVREPVFHGQRTSWARIIGFHAVGIFVVCAILHVTALHHH